MIRKGTYIGVATQDGAHFARRVLEELLVVAKNDDGNIYRAEHGKLMSLLEETALAFQKGAVDGGLSAGGSVTKEGD